MGDATCLAGCGTPVSRSGARCERCRRALDAARARIRRGDESAPVLPARAARVASDALEEALKDARGLARARREAEHRRGLDGVPFREADVWLGALEAHLEEAERALFEWRRTVRDIDGNA